MNWQNGFFRMGVLAYAGWLIFVGWQACTNVTMPIRAAAAATAEENARIEKCLEGRKLLKGSTTLSDATNCGVIDELAAEAEARDAEAVRPTYWTYVGLALAPLLALAALWLGYDWIGRGFRAPPPQG